MKTILCSAFGNANWYIHFGKQFDIIKYYSPINLGPAIQLLVIYSRETFELKYQETGQSNTVYNSLQVETAQVFTFRRMEKYTGISAHNTVLSTSEYNYIYQHE